MKIKRCIKVVLTWTLIMCLSVFSIIYFPKMNKTQNLAFADDKNVNNYVEAKAYLSNVKTEYEAIMEQASGIYNKVEDITNKAFEAQNEMTKSRLYLGDMAKYEYQNSLQFDLLFSIFCSENLDEMFKKIQYANSVMDYHCKLVEEQQQRKANFEEILFTLNKETAKQNSLLNDANNKLIEANQVLDSLRSKLSPEELAMLESEIPAVDPGVDPGGEGGGDSPEPQPTPEPTPGPVPPAPGWATGTASAYGGESDPYTPNPGRTATQEVCDDWSTGVAIPMAWPNYKSYFHHTIQIQWNGITVLAKINDCGYMGGGTRSLDLQPGVFKAFGFQTCLAWGLRQVDYFIM